MYDLEPAHVTADLLVLIALVCHKNVQHPLVQEDGVEVVVSEEDCQLIGPEVLSQ